ncbi:MAG: hypothetical protein HXX08_09620 [Chloroflexi bacterium]|uniref:Uncharacterized protein n=1 Tax=Candidatus Chlorohelix allophototropha TaxID=3003348 RepID=A0A8T7LVT8_9CHLR|nr:hypothetical protein [Chloroflexota bacterium]WJW65503.1 hypothetical protein OZ401_001268 [Chloroflexota bacterium L227-S17]
MFNQLSRLIKRIVLFWLAFVLTIIWFGISAIGNWYPTDPNYEDRFLYLNVAIAVGVIWLVFLTSFLTTRAESFKHWFGIIPGLVFGIILTVFTFISAECAMLIYMTTRKDILTITQAEFWFGSAIASGLLGLPVLFSVAILSIKGLVNLVIA